MKLGLNTFVDETNKLSQKILNLYSNIWEDKVVKLYQKIVEERMKSKINTEMLVN